MPATPARIAFVLQQFRSARLEDAAVSARYGSLARKSDDPVETFFDNVEDAAIVNRDRMDLLGTERRRFSARAIGLDEALDLDFTSGVLPLAAFTDTEKDAELTGAVAEIGLDFAKQQSQFTVWG